MAWRNTWSGGMETSFVAWFREWELVAQHPCSSQWEAPRSILGADVFSSMFIASLDDNMEHNLWRVLGCTGEVADRATSKLQSRGSLWNFKTLPAATLWSSTRSSAELCAWDRATPDISSGWEATGGVAALPKGTHRHPRGCQAECGLHSGLPDDFVEASYVVLRGPRWKCVSPLTDLGTETWNISVREMPLPKYFMWWDFLRSLGKL